MLEKIKEYFGLFHDSVIKEIRYSSPRKASDISVELIIHCKNIRENWVYQTVSFSFISVSSFRFIDEQGWNTVIKNALLKMNDELIICDFDPILNNDDSMEENINSTLCIICEEVSFNIIS
ncbi:hypothetical protein [Siphonobacter sp. SORGH_AS_1065]|uniref:hypothetical protein n=1 Tax=Siphonobacter sp. SORGH_AS_1065 TaxID=3041795 RepID=UPI00277D8E40|nr:hypothetical protein [Siphonobacter sp. SORGH_AS_1065]MDQ1089319.1 hypothetical protein [Siphonobacter sp. SORGH_AS_1065]